MTSSVPPGLSVITADARMLTLGSGKDGMDLVSVRVYSGISEGVCEVA